MTISESRPRPRFLSLYRGLLPALVIVILAGCGSDQQIINPPRQTLVGSTKLKTWQSSELQLYLGLSGLHLPVSTLQYDVNLYKVTYNSTLKGQAVLGSGLVVLPAATSPVGMISFQHGTIASHAEAPSLQPPDSPELILYSALASPGLIAVIPDYFGFGTSADVLHPYFVRDATSTAILDLLIAARDLAKSKGVNFNENLFLAGYSEGGYATMAAHRAIQLEPMQGFKLVASFPASGGYDVKGMQEYFFGLTNYADPYYLAFIATAYRDYYDWTQPATEFFQDPYAGIIPGLFDGSKNGGQINAQLTMHVPDLIDPELLADIDTDDKYQYIVDAFDENSLLDWKPTIKMFMYHGDADVTVPYQNSVDTYNQLIANGTSTQILTITTFPDKDHATGVNPYIEDIIPKILSLQ